MTARADIRCATCHPKQARSYPTTGMGRSIGPALPEGTGTAKFRHEASGTDFEVRLESGQLLQEMHRGGASSRYRPFLAIGSGHQGKSYLWSMGDAFFESPISWYRARGAWDLSPGYEGDVAPDFYRPVTVDCLGCHANAASARPGSLNRYAAAPAAIDCERCHGNPEEHLGGPSKANIVNPSRLSPDRRNAVCEQCHLAGEARIANPGKQFSEFRPGMQLEQVFSIYVRDAPEPGKLKVVSHSEQMVRSRCFQESKQALWCGTCHDPHEEPINKAEWYRRKCIACHSSPSTAEHQAATGPDCAGCHMKQAPAYDGGHTAFTDHWIRAGQVTVEPHRPILLRAWREPEVSLRERNLGLAYIGAGQLQTGLKLLGNAASDGAVETARGFVLLRSGSVASAVSAFRRASAEQPNDSTRQLNLAAALATAGERAEAKQHAERAIELEPLLEDAYVLLAEIEPGRARYWKQRYGSLVPQRKLP